MDGRDSWAAQAGGTDGQDRRTGGMDRQDRQDRQDRTDRTDGHIYHFSRLQGGRHIFETRFEIRGDRGSTSAASKASLNQCTASCQINLAFEFMRNFV